LNKSTDQQFSGWRVCVVLAMIASLGMALPNAFGLVLEPVAKDFGLEIVNIAFGMSIFMLSVGLTAPILGKLADSGPIKPVMIGGVLLMVAGIAVITHAESGLVLALGMFVASVGIVSHGMVACNAIITNWFVERRATALAMVAVGLSVGGIWIPPATSWLMDHGTVEHDWRHALQILSYFLGVVALLLIGLGVVRTPEDLNQYPDGDPSASDAEGDADVEQNDADFKRALAGRDIWLLAIGFGVITMVSLAHGSYIVPFLESNGIEKYQASFAISALAMASIMGSLSAGAIADRMGPKIVLIFSQLLIIIAFLGYLTEPGYVFSLVCAAMVGLGVGAFMPMQPASAGSRFGRAIAGRVIGIFGLMGLPFSLSAIPVAAWLSGMYGSYEIIFMVGVAMLIGVLVLLGLAEFEADEV
jgi:MFS family permease